MKKLVFILWIEIIGGIFQTVYAQTYVSGLISGNTTWTLANSPYIVTGNILVNSGVTLNIEPGVTVKFDTTKVLQIDGELIAIGTAQSRITFTASDPTPVRGSWGRIQFSHTSSDVIFDSVGNYGSGCVMKYCDIKYGGGVAGNVTVFCDTAAPYFSHCRISNCLKNAIYFVGAVGRIEFSSIRDCGGTALLFANPNSGDLIIRNDTLTYNAGGVILNGSEAFSSVTIQGCLFGHTGNAVSFASSGSSVIENSEFTSNSTALNITNSVNSVISNNIFIANADVIRGSLGTTASISDNKFTANTNSVIGNPECYFNFFIGNYYNGSTLSASSLTLSNNDFENNKGAVYMSASYSIIQGNTFRSNQFIPVLDCYSWYSGGPASYFNRLVEILGGEGLMINNVFERNTVASSGSLVRIEGAWEVAYNLIKDNSTGSISCDGKVNICRNTFLNNSGNAVTASGSSAGPAIHHNQFLNNSIGNSTISISNNSVINNNEFRGNSPMGPIVSITGSASTVSNNQFLNNLNTGYPIVLVSNSSSTIHNNDFLNNNGVSLRINGSTLQPVIAQNNFVNPGVQFELQNQIPFGSANLYVPNNYWGTTDTAHIDSVIQDFFDSGSLSVTYYTPVLSAPATLNTNALCFTDSAISLSGTILTETGLPVSGVTVKLSGSYNLMLTTDADGGYDFIVPENGTYTVTPSNPNDSIPNNGITSLDVLLMRKHILGIAPLPSPYKIIAAAEVNAVGDTTITTQDILFTRSIILGNITSFPTNRLWQFVPSDYVFPDNTHPFPFPTSRTYTNITTNQTNQNFIGIKLGDVNDSWDPNIP